MDVDTWNVLHDGRVIAAGGSVPGDLRLSVEIAYLCLHLPTKAEHLVVTLVDCEQFEYRPYQQPALAEPSAVADLGLELLTAGAGLDGGCIIIECADGWYGGQLLLRYTAAHLHTAEGHPLSQSEVESAAARYWSMWQQKHAEPKVAPDCGIT
jgi:hypothetical protein